MDKKLLHGAHTALVTPMKDGAVSYDDLATLVSNQIASGISGVFMETHPNPKEALSDGPNAVPLAHMSGLLGMLKDIDELVKSGNII